MRKMICDRCGSEVKGLYTFSIRFDGELKVGGCNPTWDGPKSMGQQGQRRLNIELCVDCSIKAAMVVGGFLREMMDPEEKVVKKDEGG